MPKPPSTIGQNAAEYGRTKTPRSARAKQIHLAVVAIVVVVIVLAYALTR